MALGDGITWDESNPTDSTVAVNIDDYNRDLRKGVRSRLALEHEWPSSQSATSEGGRHKFITFQNQTGIPSGAITGTQIACLYVKTQALYFAKTDTTETLISITADGTSLTQSGTSIGLLSVSAGGQVAISSGLVTHGGTVPLISGFSSAQCKVIVSPYNIAPPNFDWNEKDNIKQYELQCWADANRVVTCRVYLNAYGWYNGTANYLMIGIK